MVRKIIALKFCRCFWERNSVNSWYRFDSSATFLVFSNYKPLALLMIFFEIFFTTGEEKFESWFSL